MNKVTLFLSILISINMYSQANSEELPYYQIPDNPESYTAGAVAARMIDGLGFRYYWTTENLRDEDLAYRPNDDARTTAETIDHIYGLSKVIVNSTLQKPNIRTDEPEMTFAEKRKKTLENIKTAADILRQNNDLSEYKIVFQRDDQSSEYPFWNNINGPIADALWHCGQVVLLRRSSGNPFNSKVSVFQGKLRE
ncbi:hypothetical protein RXV94_07930 [Yeosuana sp. MJ-SS3]|jgi:hypothetical protein|uniref:DinB family protein n=1 Tax=Gilvirhabdus luticola TaxID=3079858 RepID=A0ABU3U6Q1_9FLAO|nr:hypothetical protein [Yeosuana sp. MJ-SS3]MDU8886085.1 hypothetical protein [Yeosuana sp. MJ-SS3]